MIAYNTLIVLLGAGLFGAGAGLIGSFAVLRRRALTGDALAHAALPGLCLAFLAMDAALQTPGVTEWFQARGWNPTPRNLPILLGGAWLSGVLGIGAITALKRWSRIKEDAAIGIVLSVFFGAGIVLSRLIQNRHTAGSKAGLDSFFLGKTAGMILSDVYMISAVSLAALIVIVLLYKEFKLITFDPQFAQVQGWPSLRLDLTLMGLITVAVVIGLPAVGVVLTASILILPAATARFWTERFGTLLGIAAFIGMAVGIVGTMLSAQYSHLPAGPIIVLVGTGFFTVSLLGAPRRGLIARGWSDYWFRHELSERNLFKILYELNERHLPARAEIAVEELASRVSWSSARLARFLSKLQRQGALSFDGAGNRCRLSDQGLWRGGEIVRRDRLWHAYMAEGAAYAVDLSDDRVETRIPQEILACLIDDLKRLGRWPDVPESAGEVPS